MRITETCSGATASTAMNTGSTQALIVYRDCPNPRAPSSDSVWSGDFFYLFLGFATVGFVALGIPGFQSTVESLDAEVR